MDLLSSTSPVSKDQSYWDVLKTNPHHQSIVHQTIAHQTRLKNMDKTMCRGVWKGFVDVLTLVNFVGQFLFSLNVYLVIFIEAKARILLERFLTLLCEDTQIYVFTYYSNSNIFSVAVSTSMEILGVRGRLEFGKLRFFWFQLKQHSFWIGGTV